MDSSRVDQGARGEDAETSDQIAAVEELQLEVEAQASQKTHDTYTPHLRKPSLLEDLIEQVGAVPYLVAIGLQKLS